MKLGEHCPICKTTCVYFSVEDGAFGTYIHNIQKVKEPIPLFTTEDKAAIFEGMEYWYVSGNSWKLVKCGPAKRNAVDVADGWFFSTKETAENWIGCNKPVLTFKEVTDWISRSQSQRSFEISEIYEIVKSKIKTDQ